MSFFRPAASARPFPLWAILLPLFAVAVTLHLLLAGASVPESDYWVFYRAGLRWLAGENLYQATDGHLTFKYLPPSALVQAPLALLPLPIAAALWFGLLAVALVMVLRLCRTLVITAGLAASTGLLVLTFFILLKSLGRELQLGQINLLMGWCMLLALGAQLQEKPTVAGLWAALALALKPYALLLPLYWLIRRQWRAAGISLGVYGLLFAVSLLRWPPAYWPSLVQGFREITLGSSVTLALAPDNASMLGAFSQWFTGILSAKAIALLAYATLALLAALFLPSVLRRPYTPRVAMFEVAALLVFLTLASPQGWYYGICCAPLAIVLILASWQQLPIALKALAVAAFVIIGLTLFDIVVPLFGRPAFDAFMTSGAHTLAFAALIALLAWLAWYRAPQPSDAR